MKIAVVGGTGFVGSYLVDELVAQNHKPVLLVRPGSEARVPQPERCAIVTGDVRQEPALRETLADCAAAIYNIGILRQDRTRGITFEEMQYRGAMRTIDIAAELGVGRFLLMSANGVRADGTAYQRTKYQAEQHLASTGLDYTIFRPSVIFGDPRGRMEFCTQLRDDMINMPFPAPLFFEGLIPRNAGAFQLSPVHVSNVAKAFVNALDERATSAKTYCLGGPKTLTWKTIIETIARACGKRKFTVPVPALQVRFAATVFERFDFFPVTRDQLTMLLEGNTCDASELFSLLGIEPVPFDQASLAYLRLPSSPGAP